MFDLGWPRSVFSIFDLIALYVLISLVLFEGRLNGQIGKASKHQGQKVQATDGIRWQISVSMHKIFLTIIMQGFMLNKIM